MKSAVFIASLDHLHEMLSFIRNEAEKLGANSFNLYKIELASEEAIVNVIRYSYEERGGEITIRLNGVSSCLTIAISDKGRPFNPLEHMPKSKAPVSLEKSELGGVGLILIQKCMDQVSYERKDDQNILTLKKNIP